MNNCFIILAAGKSERFNSKIPKSYQLYKGKTIIDHNIDKVLGVNEIKKILVVTNKRHNMYLKKIRNNKVSYIYGGSTRAMSSYLALKSIKKYKFKNVLIHDAARPDFSIILLKRILKNLKKNICVIPMIKSNDSIKLKDDNKFINMDRKKVFFSQTPQGFNYKELLKLQKVNNKVTDDASLFIDANKKIKIINGDINNNKITFKNDLESNNKIYYGIGFDVHRLVPNRSLYLGGLKIKSKLGTLGHSDGDPVLHSIIDSLLGACRMGDIGEKFSDNNKKFKNIRSTILLKKILKNIKIEKYSINNIDINIITQTPKIKNYKKRITKSISRLCNLSIKKINIKGKTTEKLGLIGKEKAIACEVITSVIKNEK